MLKAATAFEAQDYGLRQKEVKWFGRLEKR
jgi:hypothetical protein